MYKVDLKPLPSNRSIQQQSTTKTSIYYMENPPMGRENSQYSINLPLLNKEFSTIFSRTNAKDTKPLKIHSSRITTNICDAIVDFDNNNKKRYHQVGLSI